MDDPRNKQIPTLPFSEVKAVYQDHELPMFQLLFLAINEENLFL